MEGEGLQASRRSAIAYLFEHVHGNPPESEWQGRGGVLGKVMRLRGCWGPAGHGYEERWPDKWEAELDAKVSQKLVCITKVRSMFQFFMFNSRNPPPHSPRR